MYCRSNTYTPAKPANCLYNCLECCGVVVIRLSTDILPWLSSIRLLRNAPRSTPSSSVVSGEYSLVTSSSKGWKAELENLCLAPSAVSRASTCCRLVGVQNWFQRAMRRFCSALEASSTETPENRSICFVFSSWSMVGSTASFRVRAWSRVGALVTRKTVFFDSEDILLSRSWDSCSCGDMKFIFSMSSSKPTRNE